MVAFCVSVGVESCPASGRCGRCGKCGTGMGARLIGCLPSVPGFRCAAREDGRAWNDETRRRREEVRGGSSVRRESTRQAEKKGHRGGGWDGMGWEWKA